MKLYLIHGIFFQNGQFWWWHGTLREEDGKITGEIDDDYGPSSVTEVTLDEAAGTLAFTKQYRRRPDLIRYELKRREGEFYWDGRYYGPATGVDAARCVVVATDEHFFTPPFVHPVALN